MDVSERLERLSERLAEEGFHEAAEIMLDERHLALQRCLANFTKVKLGWFGKWKVITS